MTEELIQNDIRDGASVIAIAQTLPQKGDKPRTLLAKVAAICARLSLQARAGVVYDEGLQPRAVRRVFANIEQSKTDEALVTAVAGYRIRVIGLVALTGGTATDLTLNSKGDGGGTAITPLLANGVNGGEVLPRNPDGYCETHVGEGLTCTTGAGATTGLIVHYILVPTYEVDENLMVLFDEAGQPLAS